jgi:hypothetical protein
VLEEMHARYLNHFCCSDLSRQEREAARQTMGNIRCGSEQMHRRFLLQTQRTFYAIKFNDQMFQIHVVASKKFCRAQVLLHFKKKQADVRTKYVYVLVTDISVEPLSRCQLSVWQLKGKTLSGKGMVNVNVVGDALVVNVSKTPHFS